jgi:hypothetical protein
MLEYLYGKRFGSKVAWANRLRLFSNQTFSRINTPTFSNLVNLHTYRPMKMKQSVSKRRHIKFRRQGITQKEAYNELLLSCNWRTLLQGQTLINGMELHSVWKCRAEVTWFRDTFWFDSFSITLFALRWMGGNEKLSSMGYDIKHSL